MENETKDKIHVLEFSPMQKQFHVGRVSFEIHKRPLMYGFDSDWFCLGIFKSYSDLSKYLDWIRSVMCRDEYSPWTFKEDARKEDVSKIKKILRWID